MKRFKEIAMVDLAIASNFARELTEEQFGQSRPKPRRRSAPGTRKNPAAGARGGVPGERSVRRGGRGAVPVEGSAPARAERSARRSAPAPAEGAAPAPVRSKGFAATAVGRVLSRLVHVRG
jgi:hypothetical protein